MRCLSKVGCAAAALAVAGCGDDARLADHTIPTVQVQTVSDGGMELDVQADPQDVAYVLLQAIRDDVQARKDRDARERALARQLNLCDPDYIYALYRQAMGPQAVYSRDEWVYKRVYLWAPTLAHYVASFDLDLSAARSLMVTGPTPPAERWSGETVKVDFQVQDPQGDPDAGVVVRIWLHKHETGYWRVYQVGFAPFRKLPIPAGVEAPAGVDPENMSLE